MGFRQLFKRVVKHSVKPAAMAMVAGGLALSLVVTTPSNAQAFVPPVPLPVVFGATEMVIPELMATSAVLGPVGWGIAGATVLGIGLYATRDYWLPYVTGAFGQPDGDKPSAPGGTGTGYGTANANHVLDGVAVQGTDGRSVAITQHYACASTCSYNGHLALRYLCKNTSTGAVIESKPVITIAASITQTANLGTQIITCNAGYLIKGIEAGLAGDGALPLRGTQPAFGPSNHLFWGDLLTGGFDPRGADVKLKSTVECIRPDGSKFTITADSLGSDGAVKMPSCEAAESGAHATGKESVTGLAPGATNPETLWDVQAPPVSPDKGLCAPTRPGPGCKLQILIDSAPCVVGAWNCINWLDLSKDPNWTTRISCQYGPYTVPLSTCNPLERGYDPDGAPASEENTDGDPSTRKNADPAGNPQTGEPPVTVPTVPGGPATGAPPGSSTEQAECFPSGWAALNPVEWVMKPVGCALDAAFKPKADIQSRLTSMQSRFSTKVPVTWFGGNVANVSGGSCPTNWAIDVQGQHVPLICGTPAEGIILAFRPVMGAMLIVAALWPLVRSLFYAAIPILKVNPS